MFRDYHGNLRFTPKRLGSKLLRESKIFVLTIQLEITNRLQTTAILGDVDCVVSLTSHGRRLRRVHRSIESIARGDSTPRKMILWVDNDVDIASLPRPVKRLMHRGLEVRASTDAYGPHTKYYPYVSSVEKHIVPLVTADDDILYPRHWLARLTEAVKATETESIVCYRAHRVELHHEGLAPYSTWRPVRGVHISATNFATGVSGVWYPPIMLNSLRAAGTGFQETCPRADDIWLHVVALRNAIPVRQVEVESQFFFIANGSQVHNLLSDNAHSGGNDEQIRATYSAQDFQRLRNGA